MNPVNLGGTVVKFSFEKVFQSCGEKCFANAALFFVKISQNMLLFTNKESTVTKFNVFPRPGFACEWLSATSASTSEKRILKKRCRITLDYLSSVFG